MRLVPRALEVLCVAILALLVAVPFIQVIARDVFGSAIVGAEEFTRFLLIALVFATYPLAVRSGENIVMGEFQEALPRRGRIAARLAVSILAIAGCGFMAFVTFGSIFQNLSNATPTLHIPFWLFLGFTFCGFLGAALVHLVHLRRPPQIDTNVSL
ncbi:TRAP transporter small permease [Pararhizobium haloflavum]|uniref:TRAP transporter small permease n=1 Tax=Pararhizobium haloflavum TaxID=2037914 RepID=UPI000C19E1B9|nr:TRAP transporter small permease [Pararhizobium haloflavum]